MSEAKTMTASEKAVVQLLADAWDAFLQLPAEHSDDTTEFRHGIHALQDKVLSRPSRRSFSDPTPDLGAQGEPVAWACAARTQGTAGGNDPADCDWPVCGCDPHADKVIAALQESGALKPAPAASRPAVGREEIARAMSRHQIELNRFTWTPHDEMSPESLRRAEDAGWKQFEGFAGAVLALLDPRDDTRAGGAEAQEGGWLPIETAPEDNAKYPIQICGGGFRSTSVAWWRGEIQDATLWRPMTAPPPSPAPETRGDTREGGV